MSSSAAASAYWRVRCLMKPGHFCAGYHHARACTQQATRQYVCLKFATRPALVQSVRLNGYALQPICRSQRHTCITDFTHVQCTMSVNSYSEHDAAQRYQMHMSLPDLQMIGLRSTGSSPGRVQCSAQSPRFAELCHSPGIWLGARAAVGAGCGLQQCTARGPTPAAAKGWSALVPLHVHLTDPTP